MGQQAFLSSHEFYSRNVSCSIVTPYCKILSIASTNSVCLPAFRSSFSFFRYCSGRFRPFLWYCSTKRPSIRMVQTVETPFAGFQTYKNRPDQYLPRIEFAWFPLPQQPVFQKVFSSAGSESRRDKQQVLPAVFPPANIHHSSFYFRGNAADVFQFNVHNL